jgi:hypothetical protein
VFECESVRVRTFCMMMLLLLLLLFFLFFTFHSTFLLSLSLHLFSIKRFPVLESPIILETEFG